MRRPCITRARMQFLGMRQVSIVLALATLTGCSAAGTASGTDGESTSSIDTPDTGIAASSTADPAAPTTSAGSASGDPSTGDPSSGDDPTTTAASITTGDPTIGDATTGGTTTTGGDATTGDATTGDPEPAWTPKKCPPIYAQELLPTFELEMSADVLKAITAEWLAADDSDLEEHPLKSFKYEDIVITDATVRLRGNDSHWPNQGKMQFEVAFHTNNKKGRFLGLKHVIFDAAEFNRSFLRDRLSLAILRDAGVKAPCANNVRIMLNGEYYGLFTNIEKVDSEFLERNFEDPDGNLYKRSGGGWTKKPNEEDPDKSDVKALEAAKTVPELLAVMNLEQAVLEWAAEAVIPDRDGAWAGGLNLYIYNDPQTGFNVIPWDLDDTFTRLPFDTDPYLYKKPPEVFHGRPFYDIATSDPVWFAKYIDAVDHVVKTAYDVTVLHDRIDAWAAQIADAAAEDKNKPFTTAQHVSRIKEKRKFVADRAEFLADWIKCWKDGGTDTNEDGKCEPK